MSKKLQEVIKNNGPLIFLLSFYFVFHIFLSPSYWDDENYRVAIGGSIKGLFSFWYSRYMLWTSRTTIDIVMGILSLLPHVVWKILNMLIIMLLFRDMEWFLKNIFDISKRRAMWELALLLCAFPFSIMATAGWMATTANYLWVISLGWYALNKVLKQVILGKRLSRKENVCVILAVLYSGCFESVTAIMLIGIVAAIIYEKFFKHRNVSKILWIILIIVLVLFIEILICPGNKNRLESDAGYWMLNYNKMNLMDKLRMGIVTAYMHFVSLPSPIFFILGLSCFVGACLKQGKPYQKIMAALPLVLDVIWTCYYLINYLIGNKTMTYQVPKELLIGGIDTIEQIVMIITVMIWFAALLYTLLWALSRKKDFILCLTVLLVGCVPEIIVGLSSTVVTSMLRTVIYLYLPMILVILCLWEEMHIELLKYKWLQKMLYLVLVIGIMLNAMQLTRHIIVYG